LLFGFNNSQNYIQFSYIDDTDVVPPPYASVQGSTPAWSPGYHHMAVTFDTGADDTDGLSDVTLYFDGTQVGTGTVPTDSVTIPAAGLYFGEDTGLPDNEGFRGHADDILIYDRALTANEVKGVALAGTSRGLLGQGGGIMYTAEGDPTDGPVADQFIADGSQDGTLIDWTSGDTVGVDNNPANAKFGDSSIKVSNASQDSARVSIADSQFLGEKFTLATFGRYDLSSASLINQARVFTSYDGSDAAGTGQLLFDVNPFGEGINGFRFLLGHDSGYELVTPPSGVTFNDNEYHHFAAVYDQGDVSLYLDGTEVATGTMPTVAAQGPVILKRDLLMGEDVNYNGTGSQEQFVGHFDDTLVLSNTALDATKIGHIAGYGAHRALGYKSGIMYTAEGNPTDGPAGDVYIADGHQNGTLLDTTVDGNPVDTISIDNNPANAKFGDSSVHFSSSGASEARLSARLQIDDSQYLGEQFTMAVWARYELAGSTVSQTRLFTSYDGSGGARAGELLFDVSPNGGTTAINGFRFLLGYGDDTTGGTEAVIPDSAVTFDDQQYHHFAAVYDNGEVTLYLDGTEVATGTMPNVAADGPVILKRDLLMGEDINYTTAPWGQEQFKGHMDDIVVLPNWALSQSDIQGLYSQGAEVFFQIPEPGSLVLLMIALVGLVARRRS
jgi:hypothetical protein